MADAGGPAVNQNPNQNQNQNPNQNPNQISNPQDNDNGQNPPPHNPFLPVPLLPQEFLKNQI